MTPEEEIKYHEDKITELKKQLNTCDIKEGELCYFWSNNRPNEKVLGFFNSKKGSCFLHQNKHGFVFPTYWDHCEPVIKKYGLKLWVARDKSGALWIFIEKPIKRKSWWNVDGGEMRLPSELFPNVKWEDDEPTLIEV